MSMPKSRQMTGQEPSSEPDPQQLHLSDESEEEYEEDEEEESEVEVDTAKNTPLVTNSPPMRIKSSRYHLPAEQQDWFDKHFEIDKKPPRLENGIVTKWKLFRAAHKIYREEQNGTQPMVKLISARARQGLIVHLEMNTQTFLKLTDEQITSELDNYFKLNHISNYKDILNKIHMIVTTNDSIDIDKIQLYVEDFINILHHNPHFQKDKLRGAPPKLINEIFIEGLQPPVFRGIVRDLGTTKIMSTIQMLPDIYSEAEIYMKWKLRSDEIEAEQVSALDKESKGTMSGRHCTYCLSTRPNLARGHTDAMCYFLHPELRKERDERQRENTEREGERARRDKDQPKGVRALYAATVKQTDKDKIMALEEEIAFLTCLKNDKGELGDEDG